MTTTVDRPSGSAPAEPPGHRWGDWLLAALPALAFLATFGLFFVDKNREARTVLKSGRGILTGAAIVAGYVLVALITRRLARRAWAAALVLTIVVLALAAWIVRPYYVDKTAGRTLVTAPVGDAQMTAAARDGGGTRAAAPTAQRISTGGLRGIGHDASGSVSVIRKVDGSLVVRFENFDIEGVPDPRVYLVEGADRRSPGGVALGRLHGTRGQTLDYPVPADVRAGPGWTVLVWCRAFSVPIANATQTG
jgi:hypothetical protein